MPDYNSIAKDHILAITHFVKVRDKGKHDSGANKVMVTDVDTGLQFDVINDKLIDRLASADTSNSIKKVTRTEIAEKLITCYNKPFTVCFTKVTGEKRTLRGRYLSHEALMGRSQVEDLDIDGDFSKRMRQIDHRSIEWLIVDNVKYEVKKK